MKSDRWTLGVVVVVLVGTSSLAQAAAAGSGHATANSGSTATKNPLTVRSPLGNGLGRLVQSSKSGSAKQGAGGLRMNQDALTIRDRQGRVLIDLTPQAGANRAEFRRAAESRGFVVQTVDATHGTLEGFAPLTAMTSLAALPDTGTIAQALKPRVDAGSVQSQGVPFQRIDKVHAKGINGKGITIGALSDSYNAAQTDEFGDPLKIHARDDVRSGDLPGRGNPQNSKPVAVLQDVAPSANVFDEGRAMLQIAHDVAPASKLCFATAEGGLLNFAANVRHLANKNGRCGADVEVDDVTYFDEPMFSDSPLSDAIDHVAAHGVQYFSSAGNDGQQNAWQSKVRLVPAKPALRHTNLDFSNVDPALYSGGLQDAAPGPKTDVAQTMRLGPAGGVFDFQWDDPVDVDGATYGAAIFKDTGVITKAKPAASFKFTPTAAQLGSTVEFRTDAIPSGTTDLILSVDAPDGTNLGTIDTGTSPEVLDTKLTQAGTYTITITGFGGDTGDFTVDVRPVLAPSKVTTDFNALFFDKAGHFLGALADLNRLSGRPSEITSLAGLPAVQLVISRAGTGPMGATTLRIVNNGDIFFTEYSNPRTPAVFGHHAAAGATGVAAYETFKPYLPEYFSSPGGNLPIYFDSNGNRYRKPQIRRTPLIAATDGGNTTFFVSDSIRDPDTLPNFFGTSAAAPHAASIAALVLQKRGGPRSVTPRAMRRLLSRSTFVHDLDPFHAQGSSGGLTVSANGPQGEERSALAGSLKNPRFFSLRYAGSVPLKSVTFYGATASPTANGTRHPPRSDGIVFDIRPFDPAATSFENVGFPFTIGGTAGGLNRRSVHASFSVPGRGVSVAGQFRDMRLTFANGLKPGQLLRFGVDRDLALSPYGDSSEGNGADELGGATFIPQRVVSRAGMVFTAVRVDGSKIRGVFTNRLGYGYSPADGFGLIDAQRAVLGN
jgi:hypothetical protein